MFPSTKTGRETHGRQLLQADFTHQFLIAELSRLQRVCVYVPLATSLKAVKVHVRSRANGRTQIFPLKSFRLREKANDKSEKKRKCQ